MLIKKLFTALQFYNSFQQLSLLGTKDSKYNKIPKIKIINNLLSFGANILVKAVLFVKEHIACSFNTKASGDTM